MDYRLLNKYFVLVFQDKDKVVQFDFKILERIVKFADSLLFFLFSGKEEFVVHFFAQTRQRLTAM